MTITNDLDGRPTQLTLPDGRTIDLATDENGNVTALTTPKADTHRFAYDPLDRETRYEAPQIDDEPTVTETDYDLDGNVKQQRLPGGIDLNVGYDAGGRVTSVSRPEQDGDAGNEIELTYAYDGALTTRETATGPVADAVGYGYDSDFRLDEVTVTASVPADAQSPIDPATTITYGYDADSLLTEATSTPEPTLGPAATLSITRNPQHGLLDGTASGVVSDTWSWNAYAEPTHYIAQVNGNPVLTFAYERDALGRITQKTETLQGIPTVTGYTYDLAGRLETVTINGQLSESYTYDANGNRLTLTPGQGAPITATYDAQDRLLTHGACTYTHTPNGELATKTCGNQTTRYTYNLFGDLTAVEQPDGTRIEYIVDGRGRRVGKRINGELVQGFLYLNQLEPIAELDGDGQVVATFVYADRAHVPSLMHKGGKTYRIVTDHLGSPRLVIDTVSGEIAQRLAYDVWGKVTEDTNPGFQPFGFAGGLYDRDTGFVRFGARDYDPRAGRWWSKEPLGFAGGLNWFVYAYNDPINLIDINGELPSLPDWMINAGAGLGDGLLLGFGGDLRDMLGIDGGVDTSSDAYKYGSLASLAAGGARLGYAAAAKGYSMLASSGVAASAFRSRMKDFFWLGNGRRIRPPDLSRYASDAALRRAAGRTNILVNAYGLGVAASGGAGMAEGEWLICEF